MAKVDTDKFIALLIETYCKRVSIDRKIAQTIMDDVLEQMGFKVENGEIVEIEPKSPSVYDEMLDRPITDYPLSIRALSCLRGADINTVRDLIRHEKTDLLRIRNFGRKTIVELDDFIHEHHLEWGICVSSL